MHWTKVVWTLVVVMKLAMGLDFDINNHWSGGFNGQARIPITQELDGWKLHIIFDKPVKSLQSPEAAVRKLNDFEYVLTNKAFDAHPENELNINFQGTTEGNVHPHACAYIEGVDDGVCTHPTGVTIIPTTNAPPTTDTPMPTTAMPTTASPTGTGPTVATTAGNPTVKDYAEALRLSILFYDAQRSGKLPPNNPIPWRGDSALNDCVVGGWYDAGDHVKFGLPFGATVHLLLWSMHKFKDGYVKAGSLDNAYDMVKWATDYMLKAWDPATKQLVVQIGDGNADHSFWGRAEDMTMNRPCTKAGPGKPAADIAGETAAALAVGSLVFRDKGDTAYADEMLKAAKEIYSFAKANPGKYSGAGQFYSSSGYQDEMCEGAMWLYRATQDASYLADAKSNYQPGAAWALSWDDKKVACQLMLYEETKEAKYKTDVQGFMREWMPGGNVPYTPCGLAWRDKWGANRYAGNSAFLALAAANAGIDPTSYEKWGVEQINFLLGDNNHDGGCYSFEIGYGKKFPKSPHHRSASCPSIPQPCSDANLHAPGPSPQVLKGGLVGGPDQGGNYKDNREDYVMNEVALDYNSGFQGALAGINQLIFKNKMPTTKNKCPCT